MCETRACVSTVLGFRRVMDPTVRHSALVCVCVCVCVHATIKTRFTTHLGDYDEFA